MIWLMYAGIPLSAHLNSDTPTMDKFMPEVKCLLIFMQNCCDETRVAC